MDGNMPSTNLLQKVSIQKILPFILIILLLIVTLVSICSSKKLIINHASSTKKFDLIESSPTDQDGEFSVVGQPAFVFSKPLGVTEKNVAQYFSITPQVSGSWHIEKNAQVVYFSSDKNQPNILPNTFNYNTVYTVSISKNLYASTNQKLANDKKITFRTKQNPAFNIQADKKLITVQPNTAVTALFYNPPGRPTTTPGLANGSILKAIIQTATQQQLLQYFTYKDNNYPIYQFIPDNNASIKQIPVKLQSTEGDSYQIQFDKNSFTNPGFYHVIIKNDTGNEDFFLVASNHTTQVFTDGKGTHIWTSDSNTGKSIPNISAQLYNANTTAKLLDKITTNNDGLAQSSQAEDKVDFVLTHQGNDTAVTFTKSYGFYGYAATNGPTYQTFSYSDRPVYRPGDIVHYKAIIRQKQNGEYIIPTGTYYIQFLSDYGITNATNTYQSVKTDPYGTVTLDQKLPAMTQGSYPQITLSTKNKDGTYNQIDSLPVVIQSYRKPDMDISAVSIEKEYISSDSAYFTLTAKTNYGQPLSNIDFSYRILISDFQEVKDRNTENISDAVSGYYGQGDELVSGKGKFDQKGIAHLTIDTTLPAKYEQSQIATLEITPNIGVSPSFGKIAKLIHRGEFALFIDNLLGDTTNGLSGTATALDQNNPRKPIANKTLTVSLYRVEGYDNKQFIEKQSVTTNQDGVSNFSFSQKDTGTYEIAVTGQDTRDNTITARQQVYIGEETQSVATTEDTIDLKTQKSSYKIGETANVGVTANFNMGEAVVILTNDAGLTSNILSITKNQIGSNSWNLTVPIQSNFGQQVGIDIFTVNNGKVISGHTNLALEKKDQKVKTTISFDKTTYKPGDTVSATIKTSDMQGNPISADNSLSVIDAALLQIGQLNGDIFDSFYGYTPYSAVQHYDSTEGIRRNIGGGGGGCFLQGTKILMDNGETKNIEDVHVGDKIITRVSDTSSKLVSDTVVNTYRHAVTDYLTINNTLSVTWIHRIFLNNAWHEAKDAKVGDTLLDDSGKSVKITEITPHQGQFLVYNLTTSHYHTFFANGFYVHNDKGEGPRENFVDTAYWNPHIQTNAQGVATIAFKLPDNLTAFTAQTFSNTMNSQFGQATASFTVQKEFNIIPAISNFYYQGDKPVISALIQNASSQNATTEVSVTIKELGITKVQMLDIPKDSFGTVNVPLEVGTFVGDLSFLIEVKDKNGQMLDSLQLKKPVLPQGNITSNWFSFEGSKNVTLQTTYPTLDFNMINLSVVPNIITALFHNAPYINEDASIDLGQSIYAYAHIFAQTRDGQISPITYNYASLKNQYRDDIQRLLLNRSTDHWNLPPYSNNESLAAMNLWLAEGLNQARETNILNGITNIDSIVNATKTYVKSLQPQVQNIETVLQNQSSSDLAPLIEEQIARELILGEKTHNNSSPENLAVQILNGNNKAIRQLRSGSLPTADDRYIWDGSNQYSRILPVLAMIEKGSIEDADKAIKGLSFASSDTTQSPLALLAGALYTQRKNIYVDEPDIQVTANNEIVYTADPTKQYTEFNQSFLIKNTNNHQTKLQIRTNGQVPVYSTVVQTDYTNRVGINPNNSFIGSIMSKIGLNYFPMTSGQAKEINSNLKRVYKDIKTGRTISSIQPGQAGIVALIADNNFSKYLQNNSAQSNRTYTFILEDAISPAYIYLTQTNDYSNSPQYQSVLHRIFPGDNIYYGNTIPPSDYSDEAVSFSSTMQKSQIILPYVVYNASAGTYYQPKTSLVFPILGLIANEK